MTCRRLALFVGAVGLGLLGGCASDTDDAASPTTATCPVTVVDPWVKATDTEMTGAFGSVQNTGDAELVISSASSPSAGRVEIHEVVQKDGSSVMQPKQGGLVIPAGGTATLAPGGDHLMLMELPAPIQAGQDVTVTLTCQAGGTATFTAVAKPFEGGAEKYVPGSASPGASMSMSASPTAS